MLNVGGGRWLHGRGGCSCVGIVAPRRQHSCRDSFASSSSAQEHSAGVFRFPSRQQFGVGCLAGLGGSVIAALQRHKRLRLAAPGQRFCTNVATRNEATTVVSPAEVIAPPRDERKYRILKLPNGLQTMLASDPKADTAAAAVTISCGSLHDPDELLGLAHFHEHMLFLGTERYPSEDDYNCYLSEHGGHSNAYTSGEYTCYHFTVGSSYLSGALDRFSAFFVCPTFTPSALEREMRAVDSESSNYATDDFWRILQVLKATVSEKHPFHRFEVGNLETLGKDTPLETREQVVQWNGKHYQAGAMRLAVVGKESLDELQEMVEKLFTTVRSGDGQPTHYPSPAWPQECLGRYVRTVPVQQEYSLKVFWPLPPKAPHRSAKPEIYIAHLLGHEGEGSLRHALSSCGWVDGLSAGSGLEMADCQLFEMDLSLTPEGDEHRDEILALVFRYVSVVRDAGPQEWIYKEIATLQEIAFAHAEESPAVDAFVSGTSKSMFLYPERDILRGPHALDEWKPEVVAEYLEMLNPERALVFSVSSAYNENVSTDTSPPEGWAKEQWYGAWFKTEPLADVLSAAEDYKEQLDDFQLHLPAPNRFIPQDFSLKGERPDDLNLDEARLPRFISPPTLCLDTDSLLLWYKTDFAFRTPRQWVLAHILSPAYDLGPEVVMMMRLFTGLLRDDLNSFSYDAAVAGLSFSVDFSENMSLSVGGFSDRLEDLLQKVTERLTTLQAETEEIGQLAIEDMAELSMQQEELLYRLESQRQMFKQSYMNITKEDPYSVAGYYLTQIMLLGSWHISEYLEALEKDENEENPLKGTKELSQRIALGVKEAMAKTHLEVMVHGNACEEDAVRASKHISSMLDTFSSASLGSQEKQDLRRAVTKVPEGSPVVFEYDLGAENPEQENSCTMNLYQVGVRGFGEKLDACLDVACHVASTSAFNQLRTEEQLGYIAQAGGWRSHGAMGLQVLVQGNRLSPSELDVRMEAWLEKLLDEFESMAEDEFNRNVQAVVRDRTNRFVQAAQEAITHWSEILPRTYCFDRVKREVETLEAVTLADVITFLKDFIVPGAPKRRKVSIRVAGINHKLDAKEDVKSEGMVMLTNVQEIRDFHASESCERWPRLQEMPGALDVARKASK